MEEHIKFENAQELQKQFPDTFFAPDKATLEQIGPGDFIKVCTDRERFWAEVISVEEGKVTAEVANMVLPPFAGV